MKDFQSFAFCFSVSQVPSLPLFSLEKPSILEVGLELGFLLLLMMIFFKIFMASFFTPDFLFDDIKKKHLFALHKTSELLITVSCCSPLQPFHLLYY